MDKNCIERLWGWSIQDIKSFTILTPVFIWMTKMKGIFHALFTKFLIFFEQGEYIPGDIEV